MSDGFRPAVLADYVGDRQIELHKANLFDMAQKYADVIPAEAVLTRVQGASRGQPYTK